MSEIFNSIDFFTKYAEETHRTINSHEIIVPVTAFNKISLSKRSISIPYNDDKEIFLLCYNNPKEFSKYPFYCGIFFSNTVAKDFELSVKKLFFIDRINPFKFNKNRYKTNTSFDSKAIIETNDGSSPVWLLNNDLQQVINKLFKIDQRITVGYNLVHPDFEESLKGKSTLGFLIDDWIFDTDKIEQFFELALKFQKLVK